MKKASKWLALVLCALMLVSVFAGCGKTEQQGGEQQQQTTQEQAQQPTTQEQQTAPAEKIKITYSNWGTAEESKTVMEVAAKYNQTQDKVEVVVEAIPWESYMETLTTRAAGGNLPDTGIMNEAGVLQWASQGLLLDISDMYGQGEAKPLDNLAFRYQGKPVAYSVANEILLLFYNKKMFDDAGVAYPPTSIDKAWTWDEFVNVAKQLTFDKNGKRPGDAGFDPQNIVQYGAMVENLTWQLEVWCLSNGGGFYNEDGTEVIINKPESIEAIQKVADLHLVHHVAPYSAGTTDDGVQRSLIAGTVAMTTNGQWNIGTCLNTWKAEGNEYGVAVLPYMKKKVTLCTGGPNVVFAQTKYPRESMDWLKWYAQEENSWSLIEQGIWMPVLDKWYNDETLTRKWVENPNFPPYEDYKSAVVDVAKNLEVTKQASWYYVNNTVDFNNLLGSILGDVWSGKITAEKAINDNYDALVAAFKGQ